MLREYALSPDIFDKLMYSTGNLCPVNLSNLSTVLLDEAIISNLCDGGWSKYLSDQSGRFHATGNQLIKSLRKESRLTKRVQKLSAFPVEDVDWAYEAVASHKAFAMNGVIVSYKSAPKFTSEPIVSSIELLNSCSWWTGRSPSARPHLQTTEYLQYLKLILQNSNSLMFIDHYLDPTALNYKEFYKLLLAAERPNHNVNPVIELHRVCYVGTRRAPRVISNAEWENSFKRVLAPVLGPKGLNVNVYIWDDFHDRYLISNLIGLDVPHGFDISNDPKQLTTWTRLGRDARDDIQREFDPAANRHELLHKFAIL